MNKCIRINFANDELVNILLINLQFDALPCRPRNIQHVWQSVKN